MRTTVTVDSDVEQMLRHAMQQSGQSFKTTLNQAVRKGLASLAPIDSDSPFVVSPQSMGLRPGIDPTQLQQMSDDLEVDAFRNLTHRLQAADGDSRPRTK